MAQEGAENTGIVTTFLPSAKRKGQNKFMSSLLKLQGRLDNVIFIPHSVCSDKNLEFLVS